MYAFCPGYLGFVLVSARSKRSRATELHYQGAQVFLKRPRSSPAVLNSLSAHRRRARSPHCARAGGNCCWARLAVCRRVPQPRFRSLPGRGAEAGGSSAFPFLEAVVMQLPVCASRFRGNGPAQRGQPRPAGWWRCSVLSAPLPAPHGDVWKARGVALLFTPCSHCFLIFLRVLCHF